MATKSFYKNVIINNKTNCRTLVSALETAKAKKDKEINVSKDVSTIRKSELKEFFSKS